MRLAAPVSSQHPHPTSSLVHATKNNSDIRPTYGITASQPPPPHPHRHQEPSGVFHSSLSILKHLTSDVVLVHEPDNNVLENYPTHDPDRVLTGEVHDGSERGVVLLGVRRLPARILPLPLGVFDHEIEHLAVQQELVHLPNDLVGRE